MRNTIAVLRVVIVAALGFVALTSCSNSSAECGSTVSKIRVEPERVSQSGTFEVYGESFGKLVECDDTAFFGEELEGAQLEPMGNISIELRQGSRTRELATVEANREFNFRERLILPSEVTAGKATVTAEGNDGIVEAPIFVVD